MAVAAMGGAGRADYFVPTGAVVKVANVTTGSGYTHTEGAMDDGSGGILFGELNSTHANDLMWRHNMNGVTPNATQVVVTSGGMQGAYRYSATQVVTADRDARRVSIRPFSNLATISTSVVAITGSTAQFNGPNDIAVDSAGGIYFTDPNYENFSNRPGVDGVYYIAPGATTAARVITYGTTERPNGIALSPDQKTLYVGLWANNAIMKYAVNTPGVPTGGQTFVSVTSPDGLMVDPWGNVISSRSGGISSWNPAGATLFSLTTNSQVTNVELATGAAGTGLYFTTYSASTMGLYRVGLTQVPEAGTAGVLVVGVMGLLGRRRGRG
jgi:gluconolactonase